MSVQDSLPIPSPRVKRSQDGADVAPPAKRTAVLAKDLFKYAKARTGKRSARYIAMTKLMPSSGKSDTLRAEFARAFVRLDREFGNLFCNAEIYLSAVEFLEKHKHAVIDDEACRRGGLMNASDEVATFCQVVDDALEQVICLSSTEPSSPHVRTMIKKMNLDDVYDRMRDVVTFIVMCASKPESNVLGNELDCLQNSQPVHSRLSLLRQEKQRNTLRDYFDEMEAEVSDDDDE